MQIDLNHVAAWLDGTCAKTKRRQVQRYLKADPEYELTLERLMYGSNSSSTSESDTVPARVYDLVLRDIVSAPVV